MQREQRLFHNKKSAEKCRLKKALIFEEVRTNAELLQHQNAMLKAKLTEASLLLS